MTGLMRQRERPSPPVLVGFLALFAALLVLCLALVPRAEAYVYWAHGHEAGSIGRANLDGTGSGNGSSTPKARSASRWTPNVSIGQAAATKRSPAPTSKALRRPQLHRRDRLAVRHRGGRGYLYWADYGERSPRQPRRHRCRRELHHRPRHPGQRRRRRRPRLLGEPGARRRGLNRPRQPRRQRCRPRLYQRHHSPDRVAVDEGHSTGPPMAEA